MVPDRRRAIFAISEGRSGTAYLAELLATAECCDAYHEPEPTTAGETLHTSFEWGESRAVPLIEDKIRAIVEHPRDRVYAETTNMFIKTFGGPLVERLYDWDIRVVRLRRSTLRQLQSFVELGFFSDAEAAWPSWMPLPNRPQSLTRMPWHRLRGSAANLALAYFIEIEARERAFRQRFPDIPVITVDLRSLGTSQAVCRLFEQLDLAPTDVATTEMLRRSNQRTAAKRSMAGFEPQSAIAEYLDACDREGFVDEACLLRARLAHDARFLSATML